MKNANKNLGLLAIVGSIIIGVVILSGCIGEKNEIKYSTYNGDKSTFIYPSDWEDMNPSASGMPQISGVKYIIKMQKNKQAFIMFETIETEKTPIDENQLNLYIDFIRQGFYVAGSGQFTVLHKTIVNENEATVECITGILHVKVKLLNCGNDKFNILAFAYREDKGNQYESTTANILDSFKCA